MPPSPYMMANYGNPVTPTPGATAPIQGALPFGQPNVGGMFSGDLAGSYQSSYNTALGQNTANYQNILKGYQDTLANQQTAQQAIGGGYNDLYKNVLGGIQGIGQSQAQAIADAYAQQGGQAQQDLINRGLGNSTVLSSVQRGFGLDQAKANVALANQIAQLNAGYQSSLGMAGLNYANQAAMQSSAQQNQQLGFMNSVTAQYPSAAPYSQLFQQQGMIGQADKDRAQAADQFQKQMAAAQQARAGSQMGGFQTRQGGSSPQLQGFGPNPAGGSMSSVTPFGLGGYGGGMDASLGLYGGSAGGAQGYGNPWSGMNTPLPSAPAGWENYGAQGQLSPAYQGAMPDTWFSGGE